MGNQAPFHPDLARRARFLPRAILSPRSFRLVRAVFRLLAPLTPHRSKTIRLAGGQRLQLHSPETPAATPTPALLWLHGGGMVLGDPRFDEKLLAGIADHLGVIVAAPSYRLAPEHPYPAAVEDALGALTWLAKQPQVDPARIAVGGDSAGGGLAACLAILAREVGGVRPCFQLLHEPMLDEATRGRPDPFPGAQRLWNAEANRFGWDAYLAEIDGAVPATASAARLHDGAIAGLPPAWLGIGTLDLFRDEVVSYHERLRAAGVPTELFILPGAFHGFSQVAAAAPVTRDYVAAMTAALGKALGVTPA